MKKTVLGLLSVAVAGCVNYQPVINNTKEVTKSADGKVTTNTVQNVTFERNYSLLGRAYNATTGLVKGACYGAVKGYEDGTSTNGMENASFWDKTCKFTTGLVSGIGNGAADGTVVGYNRQLSTDEEKKKAEILKEYNAKTR